MMNVTERAIISARHEEPEMVPVALRIYSMMLKRFNRIKENQYLKDPRLQLESWIAFTRRFPDVFCLGGANAEMRSRGIVTALGGKYKWMEDSPPAIIEYPIKTPEDIDRIAESGLPDPREAEAEAFEQLEYFWEWFPKNIREEYSPFYLDGFVYAGSPSEGAALKMGYDKWVQWMRLYPDVLHKWLKMWNEYIAKWVKAQEEIVGPAKFVWMGDHSPSFVGPEQYREFVLPYINKTLDRYKGALRLWHNEGYVGYMLEEVDKIDAEVWQLGYKEDLVMCKEKTHFCLAGNIHPPLLAKLTPAQVEEECKKIIMQAGSGGGLWLCTGGGMAPGTPMKNIDAMIRAVEKYGVYPLKGE